MEALIQEDENSSLGFSQTKNLLSYFPKPYPDEIFYSLIARYHDHTLSKYGQTYQKIYGLNRTLISFILPNKLRLFAHRVKSVINLTEEGIIRNHTNYHFLSAFGSEKRANRLQKYLVDNHTRFVLNRIEGLENGVFKYCPLCAKDDREKFGEAYWHRAHNLPSVISCPYHHCLLENFSAKAITVSHPLFAAESVIDYKYQNSKADSKTLEEDTQMLQILEGKKNIDFNRIKETALKKGYCTILGGKVYFQCREEFKIFVKQEHPRFNSLLNTKIYKRRLLWIINGKRLATQPRLTQLFAEFIDKAPNKGRDQIVNCINKLCCLYSKSIGEQNWKYKFSERRLKQRFIAKCPSCSLKFSGNLSAPRNYLFLEPGDLILREVEKMKLEGKSKRSIIKAIGLAKTFVTNLIDQKKSKPHHKSKTMIDLEKRDAFRQIWIAELNSKDFYSIQTSNMRLLNISNWLYRYDNEWIKRMNQQYISKKIRYSHYRNLKTLDKTVLSHMQKFSKNINLTTLNVRVSKSLLLKNVPGFGSLDFDLSKLPNSLRFVNENVETSLDFYKRRIRKYATDTIKESSKLTKRVIYKKFLCRKNSLSFYPEAMTFLNELCLELGI